MQGVCRLDLLTREELGKIDRREKYVYMLYKDMQFFSCKFVSDAYYQTKSLPLLSDYDYLKSGRCINTDFLDKNSFEVLMT